MKKLKTRLITIIWSVIIITISGFSFNGCIKEPLQTGVQESMGFNIFAGRGESSFGGPKKIFARETSPFGFWGYTVGYSLFTLLLFGFGVTSFIGGIRGTVSIGYTPKDGDDDDFEEALQNVQKMRSMKPKKREKALREALMMRQLRSGAPDERDVQLDDAIDGLIAVDRSRMSMQQQEEYLARIRPDEAEVEKLRKFFEKFGTATKVKDSENQEEK